MTQPAPQSEAAFLAELSAVERFPPDLDFQQLQRGRLGRLQEQMHKYELPVCLFFNGANIRYSTGSGAMCAWAESAFARFCIVPADGDPILFEAESSAHVEGRLVSDLRPAHYWYMEGSPTTEYVRRWALDVKSVLAELGLEGQPLAVDKLDTVGFLALQNEGIRIIDSSPATVDAREVKTPEEVRLMEVNGIVGSAMLADFEAAVVPGVRECELMAVLSESLIRHRGEYLFTGLVASGQNTNPWGTEATTRAVETGDLVGVDTDGVGYEGYVIDVSRTFLCGDAPTARQREAYAAAHDQLEGMQAALKPGITFDEFARASPELPEKYRDQRYYARAHQAGLEDEGPSVFYLEDVGEHGMVASDRMIQPNMVFCLEAYAGEVGGPDGVKLENQILVTEDGCRLLCDYPYDPKLFG